MVVVEIAVLYLAVVALVCLSTFISIVDSKKYTKNKYNN